SCRSRPRCRDSDRNDRSPAASRARGARHASRPTSPLTTTVSTYNYPVMNATAMNEHDTLDDTFFALADPTRRAILARLAEGEASVAELAEPFAMSQPAITKHLQVLERAGLVSASRDVRRRPRRLEPAPLAG